ncbi:hypothetical protein BDP27DRAFT_1444825 [Rhodocollybia butyracea]|uniref:Uncharacterized protein n=1 Tax=Rhodocollybia butyracea TaxID=206335 RepID=A0A9P5PWM9_9AGAR|nr:hypothetical protein BDP27DRAFT_1444825 [Rhodocollybia butyracea]
MCFSLTCMKMWEVAEDVRFLYLRNGLQRLSWNGNRIILLGDYTRELPQGLLTEEDRKELKMMAEIQKSHSDDEEGSNEGSDGDLDDDDVSLLDYALHEMESEHLTDSFSRCHLRRAEYGEIPEAFQWFLLPLSKFTCTSSTEDRWMLRNLTKKEFVIKSKGRASSGLVQALFSLISWSNARAISMACDDADAERMVRGPWAGDRIDVTLYSLHEHKNDPGWKDITSEVLAFLERLAKNDNEEFLEEILPFF